MGEVENHVCCDCKTKKKPRLVDFFRFKRKGKVGRGTGDGVEEVVKENGEEIVGGQKGDAVSDISKTEEKESSGGFFWNLKREVNTGKEGKQTSEEDLKDETKTSELATEVKIWIRNQNRGNVEQWNACRWFQFPARVPGSGRQVPREWERWQAPDNPAIGQKVGHLWKSMLR